MSFRPLLEPAITLPGDSVVPQAIPDARPAYAPLEWSGLFEVETEWSRDAARSLFSDFRTEVVSSLVPARRFSGTHYAFRANRESFLNQFVARSSPPAALPSVSGRYLTHGVGVYWQYPLESDAVCISLVEPGNIIRDDFGSRRFYLGQRVYVTRQGFEPWEIFGTLAPAYPALVTSLDDLRMTLDIPEILEPGMRVIPCVDCVPSETMDSEYLSAKVATAQFEAVEAAGESAMPALAQPGEVPFGVQTHQGIDGVERLVLRDFHNWEDGASVEIRRRAEVSREVSRLAGTDPRQVFPVQYLGTNRRSILQVAQTFDSTMGGSRAVWAVLPTVVGGKVTRGPGGATVSLEPQGSLPEFRRQVRALAFLRPNNQYSIHELLLDGQGGDPWTFTVFPEIPDLPMNCVHHAGVCRFSGSLTETWESLEIARLSFTLQHVDTEEDIGVEVL